MEVRTDLPSPRQYACRQRPHRYFNWLSPNAWRKVYLHIEDTDLDRSTREMKISSLKT